MKAPPLVTFTILAQNKLISMLKYIKERAIIAHFTLFYFFHSFVFKFVAILVDIPHLHYKNKSLHNLVLNLFQIDLLPHKYLLIQSRIKSQILIISSYSLTLTPLTYPILEPTPTFKVIRLPSSDIDILLNSITSFSTSRQY